MSDPHDRAVKRLPGVPDAVQERPGASAVELVDRAELADLVEPALTVVAQDPAGLGRVAATLLFDRMAGLSDAPRRVVLPTVLIPRGSGELPPPERR